MKLHKSITPDRIVEAVERQHTSLDNPGFCIVCGAEQEGCEPDARKYPCESCGKRAVYGAEELLLHVVA
jgi:hypothetical protein